LLLSCLFLAAVPAGAAGAAAASTAPAAAAAGMVLDLRGDAQADGAPLQLLGYIKSGQQIRLGKDSRLSLSHYGSKLVYQLSGPLQAQVDPKGITVSKGAPAQTRSLAEKLVLAAVDPRLSPAAVKMRALSDIALLAPANRALLSGPRPTFRWKAADGTSYRIQVDALDGRRVAEGSSSAGSWELPAGVSLVPGTGYRWTVSAAGADGTPVSGSAAFGIAADSEREAVLALRPAAGAAIEEWVLYAAILDGRRMDDEARAAWQEIAGRRPDLAPPARAR
jgi:hypothetical protein